MTDNDDARIKLRSEARAFGRRRKKTIQEFNEVAQEAKVMIETLRNNGFGSGEIAELLGMARQQMYRLAPVGDGKKRPKK